MTVLSRGLIVQITNISPTSSMEQMRTLFGHIGVISEIILYPLEGDDVHSKVCYIKYSDEISAEVSLHLNNTIFLDRALIVLPLVDGTDIIPDEKAANLVRAPPNTAAGVLPRSANWPLDVISMVVGRPGEQAIHTIEPRLVTLGFPVYPPLPAATDINRIEEIRRTVFVSNLDPKTNGDEVLTFFNAHVEVKCVRMAGTFDDRAAYVEFTEQPSVIKAFGLMGATLGDRQIMVQHSNCAIIKPNTAISGVDDTVKKTSDAPAPEKGRSRSRSKERGDRSRKRRNSRSRSQRRSRSRRRSKSGARRRSKSHSRIRRSRSKSRDRRRGGRDRSRSRGHKKSKRSKSPSVRRRRSRSRDRPRDKRDRNGGRRDRSREREKERTRRDKSRERGKEKSRERDRGRDKERDRDRSKNHGRDRSRDKNKTRDKPKASEIGKSSRRNRSGSKDRSSRKKSELKADNGIKSPSSRCLKEEEDVNNVVTNEDKTITDYGVVNESDTTSTDKLSHENNPDNAIQNKCCDIDKPEVIGVKLAGPEDMDIEVPMVGHALTEPPENPRHEISETEVGV